MSQPLPPFHLALPVTDLVSAEAFYCGLLGFAKGRCAERWIDLDFRGHQLTLHLVDTTEPAPRENAVDGDRVPARHFGLVLEMTEWRALADRLRGAGVEFVIEPRIRFEGRTGEQATMFFADPAGNVLEFKSFADPSQLFAH